MLKFQRQFWKNFVFILTPSQKKITVGHTIYQGLQTQKWTILHVHLNITTS